MSLMLKLAIFIGSASDTLHGSNIRTSTASDSSSATAMPVAVAIISATIDNRPALWFSWGL
jgi:hypothetical protein